MLTPGTLIRLKLMDVRTPELLRGHYAEVVGAWSQGCVVRVLIGDDEITLETFEDAVDALSPEAGARLRYLLANWRSNKTLLLAHYLNDVTRLHHKFRESGFPSAIIQDLSILTLLNKDAAWADSRVQRTLKTQARAEKAWWTLLDAATRAAEAAFDYVGL